MHLWQKLQQSLVCKGALGSLFGFHALLLASSKVAFQMVVLIQSVCSADGPKGEACVEVVESQDATMEGKASDQVVPAVDLQGLDVSNGEIVSPLLSLAEPEPHASSPSLECAPAPECVSAAPLPLPENLSNGDDVVVDDGSGGEGSGEESQAKMMEVESLNLDMFHVSGESEEETVDFLRRRDQQTAMKEDAPPRKGKGRGKGRGKGKGKGEVGARSSKRMTMRRRRCFLRRQWTSQQVRARKAMANWKERERWKR